MVLNNKKNQKKNCLYPMKWINNKKMSIFKHFKLKKSNQKLISYSKLLKYYKIIIYKLEIYKMQKTTHL